MRDYFLIAKFVRDLFFAAVGRGKALVHRARASADPNDYKLAMEYSNPTLW
jgi:hypothetical protein